MQKYCVLYNSVESDPEKMSALRGSIEAGSAAATPEAFAVSCEDVSRAISMLNSGKGDGDRGLNSNHLLFSSRSFKAELAKLFTAMYLHGHQASALLKATIVSIPKNASKSMSDSANYRGIALCSAIAKTFDLIFLHRNSKTMKTSNLQFAFKKSSSTTSCSLVLKEVVNYYLNRGTDVFACFLDATKAFDRVRFDVLFETLIHRKVQWPDLRLLLDLYTRQRARISWKSATSSFFRSANGIRQGSIISPLLFCIYLDSLIEELRRTGVGCHIGQSYYGVMIYADDITLLSPSVRGLQQMLATAEIFCQKRAIKFNATKTVCMRFTSTRNAKEPVVELGGSRLSWEKCTKHLGITLCHDLSEEAEIASKRNDLFGRVNSLLGNFGRMPNPVKMKLFNSQCCHFYGSQAWDITDPALTRMETAFHRCLRRILGLPTTTHRVLLPLISESKSFPERIYPRQRKQWKSMHENGGEISFLHRVCKFDSASIISRCEILVNDYTPPDVSQSDKCIAEAVKELTSQSTNHFFTYSESKMLIEWLCTS